MTLKARGLDLPAWDNRVGLAVNTLWAEFVRRERMQETTRVQHEVMAAYAMSGVDPSVDFSTRYNFVEPLLKKLLAEIDQTAYRTEYHRLIARKKLERLMQRKAEMDRLEWIASDRFDLGSWIRGKDG